MIILAGLNLASSNQFKLSAKHVSHSNGVQRNQALMAAFSVRKHVRHRIINSNSVIMLPIDLQPLLVGNPFGGNPILNYCHRNPPLVRKLFPLSWLALSLLGAFWVFLVLFCFCAVFSSCFIVHYPSHSAGYSYPAQRRNPHWTAT